MQPLEQNQCLVPHMKDLFHIYWLLNKGDWRDFLCAVIEEEHHLPISDFQKLAHFWKGFSKPISDFDSKFEIFNF